MQAEGALNGTALATLERSTAPGISVAEIAAVRALSSTTIEGHLARAVENGEKLDPRSFFSLAEEEAMRAAFTGHEGLALLPVFEKLGGEISYGKLRLFLAFENAADPGGIPVIRSGKSRRFSISLPVAQTGNPDNLPTMISEILQLQLAQIGSRPRHVLDDLHRDHRSDPARQHA